MKILSHRRLVSQRPHQDTWVVPVFFHHSHGAVNICVSKALLIVQPFVFLNPLKPVGFQIRLINHVKAILVAQAVKIRDFRIVCAADGIDIMPFHHAQVFLHRLPAYCRAARRAEIMHVNAVKQNRYAIYKETGTFGFHSPKACDNFRFIPYLTAFPVQPCR